MAQDKAIYTPLGESKEDHKSQQWWGKQGPGSQKTLSSAAEQNSNVTEHMAHKPVL